MSSPIQLPLANFSRDLRPFCLGIALTAGALGFCALAGTVVLAIQSVSYWSERHRVMNQASEAEAELAILRRQQNGPELEAAAVGVLRQRIAALNALDFGSAPAVARVLSILEDLMPPAVALQSFDYDRAKGTLDLVAVSESSEDLTRLFDVASRSPFFKGVRLIDKKQAGSLNTGSSLFEIRLSMYLSYGEPRA
jgi:hypothetical protein